MGNIVSVTDPVTGGRVEYSYDDQGQLLQAVHKENGTTTRTETYTYDNVGNILTFNNGTTSHTYTYGNTQWKDLLTAVDGNEITYDASGNPTEYYNEWPMTWVEGRRLESVTTAEGKYTYEYNAEGQRTKKTKPDGSYIVAELNEKQKKHLAWSNRKLMRTLGNKSPQEYLREKLAAV